MLAIETILGALTGYFTNDIAICQLFSKNGVVVREREQFTSLIVQVLKEKIIDEDMMNILSQSDEMAHFFESFVHELVDEAIPVALANRSLSDFDANGDLQALLTSHVDAASMGDMALDIKLLYRHFDTLIQSAPFQKEVQQALHQLGAMSLQDLGMAELIERCFAPILSLDENGWQQWLEEQRIKLFTLIDGAKVKCDNRQLGTLLSLDGEQVVQDLEHYFGVDLSQKQQVGAFAKGYTQFLEQFYVFAARVLPRVLEAHLPALLDAFYPMLVEDKEWIERMVLDSIAECNTDGNMILSMAEEYVKTFFGTDEDGDDWLTRLYNRCSEAGEFGALCMRFADFLCGLIIRQIDEWRRLNMESDEGVERVLAQYMQCRSIVVKLLDAYLALPIDNKVHRALLKAVGSAGTLWLQRCVTADKMQQWGAQKQHLLCTHSLSLLGFNEEKQRKLLVALQQWWHENGLSWLEAHMPSEITMKHGICRFIDVLFSKPLGEFLGYAQALIPYEPIADALRMTIFWHLRDFLAKLTRNQLEALSHEDIREVVLDMIGREMRPLAYLGGGIGAAAGVATGAAMQVSGVSVDPDQMALLLAARSGMYGAVGYGTNVMAVKGLFWPYKKTLGIQGLICKNQSRFASKMKNMAECYVINNEIWMQQMQLVSEHLSQHYDEFLRYGLHIIKEKREQSVRPYVEMAADHMPHQLCGLIFDKEQADIFLKAIAEKGIEATMDGGRLFEVTRHLQLFHFGVCKLAMMEATNRRLSEKVVSIVQGMTVEEWMNLGNRFLSQWHSPANRAFYDNLWHRLRPHYQKLPIILSDYSTDIAGAVGQYVQRKLAFPLQLAYRMAGGERQIERIVKHFVTDKLPEYMEVRELQVEQRFTEWMNAQFANQNFLDSGVCLSEAQGQWIVELMEKWSVDTVHLHFLSAFAWLEKDPTVFSQSFMETCLQIANPLLEPLSDMLKKAVKNDVSWHKLSCALAPLLDYLQTNVLKDISMNALLSVDNNRLWEWIEDVITVSEEEKTVIVKATQAVWMEMAPIFWQVIGQRGRELLMMVDVPNLTHDRICALSPQELEVMVRDIAQPYFTRVERMGWLGAIVAVPATMISMLLGGM